LKESIKIQIEHGIDTEVALYEQKLRGSEKTKKKLSNGEHAPAFRAGDSVEISE
jgi:hypothetical protein